MSDVKYVNQTVYTAYWVSKVETPISIDVDDIKVGDKVLAYFTEGARHFGMAIEEQIIEK